MPASRSASTNWSTRSRNPRRSRGRGHGSVAAPVDVTDPVGHPRGPQGWRPVTGRPRRVAKKRGTRWLHSPLAARGTYQRVVPRPVLADRADRSGRHRPALVPGAGAQRPGSGAAGVHSQRSADRRTPRQSSMTTSASTLPVAPARTHRRSGAGGDAGRAGVPGRFANSPQRNGPAGRRRRPDTGTRSAVAAWRTPTSRRMDLGRDLRRWLATYAKELFAHFPTDDHLFPARARKGSVYT